MNFYRYLEIDDFEREEEEGRKMFKIVEQLAEKGYFQNTQQFHRNQFSLYNNSSFVKIIRSMKKLEILTTDAHYLTLEDLALVFQSCSKLVVLDIYIHQFEMGEVVIDQLKPGFQRLRRLNLECAIVSWAGIQEMLT